MELKLSQGVLFDSYPIKASADTIREKNGKICSKLKKTFANSAKILYDM